MVPKNNVSIKIVKDYIKKIIGDALTTNSKGFKKDKILYCFHIMWEYNIKSALLWLDNKI